MRDWRVLGVVAYALFMDDFIYELVVPLIPNTPAGELSDGMMAMLYAAYALGVLLATPCFGYLGSRFGCKPIMLAGVALSALTVVIFWSAPSYGLLQVARFCQGAASAATWTAGLALIAEHYVKRRVEMMGYALVGNTIGAMLGPILSGALFQLGGYSLPFAVTACMVAVDAVLRVFVLPPGKDGSSTEVPYLSLLRDRAILVPALAVLLAAFGWGAIEPFLPGELTRAGTGAVGIGVIFTLANIAYGLSAPVVSGVSNRLPIRVVISLGVIGMAATLPLIGLADRVVPAGAALCLLAVAFAFTVNPTTAELGNAVDRRGLSCYAAAYAVFNVAYASGMMAADTLASVASDCLSFFHVLACVSVALLICVPFLLHKDSARVAQSGAVS